MSRAEGKGIPLPPIGQGRQENSREGNTSVLLGVKRRDFPIHKKSRSAAPFGGELIGE